MLLYDLSFLTTKEIIIVENQVEKGTIMRTQK